MENHYSNGPLGYDILDEIPFSFQGLDENFPSVETDRSDIGLLLRAYAPCPSSPLLFTPDAGVSFAESPDHLLLPPTLTPDEGSPYTMTPMLMTPFNGGNVATVTTPEAADVLGLLANKSNPCIPPSSWYTPHIPQITLTPAQVLARIPPIASSSSSRDQDLQLYTPLPPQTYSELSLSPLSLVSMAPSLSTASPISLWSSPLSLLPSPLLGEASPSQEVDFTNPHFLQIPSPSRRRRRCSLDDEEVPAISSFKRRIVDADDHYSVQLNYPASKSDDDSDEDEHKARQRQKRLRRQQRRQRLQERRQERKQTHARASAKSIYHRSDGPAACERCSKSFTRTSDRDRHVQAKCSDDPLKCICMYPRCGRVFCRNDAARRHWRAKHKGERENIQSVHESALPPRTEKEADTDSDEETALSEKKARKASRK